MMHKSVKSLATRSHDKGKRSHDKGKRSRGRRAYFPSWMGGRLKKGGIFGGINKDISHNIIYFIYKNMMLRFLYDRARPTIFS